MNGDDDPTTRWHVGDKAGGSLFPKLQLIKWVGETGGKFDSITTPPVLKHPSTSLYPDGPLPLIVAQSTRHQSACNGLSGE